VKLHAFNLKTKASSETITLRGAVCSGEDVSTVLLDEPVTGIISSDSLEFTEDVSLGTSTGNSLSSSGENDEEVHTENTSVGIILNSEINMFINTESEVTCNKNK